MNKKVIIPTIIAIITLVTIIIGATYAYFMVSSSVQSYTTNLYVEAEDVSTASLISGVKLNLNLKRTDMMQFEEDVIYYATEDGTPSITENIAVLATVNSIQEKKYNCAYTLKVEYSGNMKEAITGKDQVIFNIGGVDYDIFETNFPLEIKGKFLEVNLENSQTINGSLRIINSKTIDQSALAGTNMELTITASEFECNQMYNITYNLDGGIFEIEQPTTYTEDTETFTLATPIKDGYKFLGWSGTGLSDLTQIITIIKGSSGDRTYTAKWGLSSPIDSYLCSNGSAGNEPYMFSYTGECSVEDEGNDNWKIKLLTNGTFTSNSDIVVDTFLVGGGGGGGKGNSSGLGGGGGGGGYVNTGFAVLEEGNNYEVIIGDGGSSQSRGGTTTAFGALAYGGYAGVNGAGGAGGSGGGGGSWTTNSAGDGGSTGNHGANGSGTKSSGSGSGSKLSLYEFGDITLTLYAGGGGGGAGKASTGDCGTKGSGGSGGGASGGACSKVGGNASNNTGGGGGGGGGGTSSSYAGGTGGSGIVVIRNSRTINSFDFDFEYTGSYILVDEGNDNWNLKFLTSGIFIPYKNIDIEAFLVGGGGGGKGGNGAYQGGGGGGAGRVNTGNASLISGENYIITIGEGGTAGENGEQSSAFELTALGGNAGGTKNGGSGGSGGGGGGYSYKAGGAGGTIGGNGSAGGSSTSGTGGTGAGISTYAFGDTTLILYAGGGGGGGGVNTDGEQGVGGAAGLGGGGKGGKKGRGSAGVPNTGGGGGGGAAASFVGGGGGSGIVIIRNVRNS